MKKEEGFTLVELLAVIVILGIIVAIAIPAIGNVVGRATDDANDAENALVLDAARLYKVENEDASSVTEFKLYDEGYLDSRDGEDHGLTAESFGRYIVFDEETGSASFGEAP